MLSILALVSLLPLASSSPATSTSSTTAIVASPSGVELARQMRRELALGDLDRISALDRFLTLDGPERDACLETWARITTPEGLALDVYRTLRAARDRPMLASTTRVEPLRDERRPARAAVEASTTPRASTTKARDDRQLFEVKHTPSLARSDLTGDQIKRMRSGSRLHAWGAAIAVPGISSIVGGGLATGISASNDLPVWPGLLTMGLGVLVTVIGVSVMGAGDDDFNEAMGSGS